MEQNENTGDKPLKDMWEIVMSTKANPLGDVPDSADLGKYMERMEKRLALLNGPVAEAFMHFLEKHCEAIQHDVTNSGIFNPR